MNGCYQPLKHYRFAIADNTRPTEAATALIKVTRSNQVTPEIWSKNSACETVKRQDKIEHRILYRFSKSRNFF